MLVISRSKDQRVIVRVGGQELAVMIVSARHGRVRLGFEAESDIKILREELVEPAGIDGPHMGRTDVGGSTCEQAT